jgi:hypothetical protein
MSEDEVRIEKAAKRTRWAALALQSAADELCVADRYEARTATADVQAEAARVIELFERLEDCLV